jgi:NAD(P)-dependent dehydrogenase (short-subunit alcohol dehydrogenase family)
VGKGRGSQTNATSLNPSASPAVGSPQLNWRSVRSADGCRRLKRERITKFALEGLSEALADEIRPLGIKVLIVEPGAFRTGLFSNGTESPVIEAYDSTVGETRRMISGSDGSQPGDPAKAVAAILAALDAEHTPLRLPLGGDAVDALVHHLDDVRTAISVWERVTRDTALDG